ncbi:MAG: SpoIIE family protein phosphatase [archaeon]|nr:SpoIIE family protein phosphatase [archaeon]
MSTSVFMSLGLVACIVILNIVLSWIEEDLHYIFRTEEITIWSFIMIFILVFAMNSESYRHFLARSTSKAEYLVFIALFSLIALLGALYNVENFDNNFDMVPFALFLAGALGGCGTGLIVSIIAVTCLFLFSPVAPDISVCTYVILGPLAGIMCRDSWNGSYHDRNQFLKSFVAFALVCAIFYLSLDSLDGELFEDPTLSVIPILNMGVLLLDILLFCYLEKVIATAGAASRYNSDLRLAHSIQMSAVPKEFPVSSTFQISAMMQPAIEVGGDFYDVFTMKRNLIGIVIADVSDKGLPAAMFMMRAKGVVKAIAMVNNNPEVIVEKANRELCTDNDANMFVTMWFGVLDTDTGILRYSNAGHTKPYIISADGTIRKLEIKKGLAIGISDMAKYTSSQMTLETGDRMFMYTDGVTEAFNDKEELFGEDRLIEVLGHGLKTPEEIVSGVREAVKNFACDVPPSDDITMVCMALDRSAIHTITVDGDSDNLDEVLDFMSESLEEDGCPMKLLMKMQVAAEEIFVNICDHGYNGKPGTVRFYCRYLNGEMKLVFEDDARPFNPLATGEKDIDEDVTNWTVGGFGIHMVKNLSDSMSYKRIGGTNVTTLWRSSAEQPKTSEDAETES